MAARRVCISAEDVMPDERGGQGGITMRITNRIIQRNNLSNINTNKIYQDKLSTQMSTQKKISRPSEDPVVAIRALRLRSNVTEIGQYYSKNIPDAESWLDVTEAGLKNLTQIVTNMISRCTKGSNGPLKTSDREIILEELRDLGDEVYSTADADYAGRYVFAGYRTDTPISFMEEETKKYSITEQLDSSAIDTVTKVETDRLLDLNSSNYTDANMSAIEENKIDKAECYRIRLAYNNCDSYDDVADMNVKIEFTDTSKTPPVTKKWPDNGVNIEMKPYYETNPSPYAYAAKNDDAVVYVPETGELLLGKNRYADLMATKDLDGTSDKNEAEIRVTYEKSSWLKGDLRPEHYFACTATVPADSTGTKMKDIKYNEEYLEANADRQVIEYDVGFNQTIRVNSRADECFKHGIGREVDDIVNAMQDVLDLEGVKANIEEIMKEVGESSPDIKTLQNQLDAVNKALTYAKDKEQKLFEKGIGTFQRHLDDANLCITNCGTRSSKLELIKNRMQNQKTTFDTLKSDNEDVDITEVAINLNSAELTYNAALMATGKVTQSTLLNYI